MALMSVVKSVNGVPLIRLGRGGGLTLVDVKAGDRNIHDKQTNQIAGSAFNYGYKSSNMTGQPPCIIAGKKGKSVAHQPGSRRTGKIRESPGPGRKVLAYELFCSP